MKLVLGLVLLIITVVGTLAIAAAVGIYRSIADEARKREKDKKSDAHANDDDSPASRIEFT